MKNYSLRTILFSMTFLITFIISCDKTDPDQLASCPSCPYIQEIQPDSAWVGDTVKLIGENFASSAQNNDVRINNVRCTVIDSELTSTSMYISIPQNCTSGNVKLKINNTNETTNYDEWVIQNKGALPYLTIRDSSSTVDTQNQNSGPDSIHISSTPFLLNLDMKYDVGFLVDSTLCYIQSNNLFVKRNLKNSPYTQTTISSIKPGIALSTNYYESANEIFFLLRTSNWHLQQFSYHKNLNTLDSVCYYTIPSSSAGYSYDLDKCSYFLDNSKIVLSTQKSRLFNPTTFCLSDGNFTQSYGVAQPLSWDINSPIISIVDPSQPYYLISTYSKLYKVDKISKTHTPLTAGYGNLPSTVGDSISLNQAKLGEGKLCRFKDKIFYCDKEFGMIREINTENNICKNLYQSPDLQNHDFYIVYNEDADYAILLLKIIGSGKWSAYNFSFD